MEFTDEQTKLSWPILEEMYNYQWLPSLYYILFQDITTGTVI